VARSPLRRFSEDRRRAPPRRPRRARRIPGRAARRPSARAGALGISDSPFLRSYYVDGVRTTGILTSWGGVPVPAASSSWTMIRPRVEDATSYGTLTEKVPRHPVPHVAVVKVLQTTLRLASTTSPVRCA